MPTVLTHAVVGLGLAEVCTGHSQPPWFWGLSAALAALPDVDVLAFKVGIPYDAFLGHRGFAHSLGCAALVGLAVALATAPLSELPGWALWAYGAGVTASHGVLDGFTNGGLGIAYFSPFDRRRYFAPWRPIAVSPLGLAPFFSRRGLRVLCSEACWVWLPSAALAGAARLWREFT